MAGLKVYLDLMSQPARAMYIFCKATGIQHEIVPVRILQGDTKTDEYTAMNPFQKVPVLKDGDFTLTESVAMLRYLATTRDIADHWYPKDPKQQARVDEYMEWQHMGTRINCAKFFIEKWLLPMGTRIPPNEKKVEHLKDVMETTLEQVERIWLKNGEQDFIGGGKDVSVADLLAACEMEQPRMAGYDVRDKSPVLKLYMDRVQDRLNPHYAEAHVGLNEMVKKFKGEVPESHYKKIDA
eukprot:TRINITY_DN1536_c0_g1_i11.p1 TRINITY_DN1536_c0_g1~~TRINITY_DN1536_c0_g1_i11.p1  ORF type:complete len:252 (-),score=60.52 TRINITY_DN1536_c0_g1_i11:4-720(-)